ncbi:MAG: hypothetical protein Q7V43_10550, partial [Myxococcales bacterium]|nr:hypothetical protein [Myxococcales bacterium]
MRTPLALLLCSTLAIACTPSAVNDTPPRLDGAVPTDVPPGIDSPVVPDGTIAPDVVVTPDDTAAPDDAVTNPDVPADIPIMPTTCRSSRDCARGCVRPGSQRVRGVHHRGAVRRLDAGLPGQPLRPGGGVHVVA